MPRQIIKQFLNMDVADNKRRLMASIGVLRGEYEVCIEPRRLLRTLAQNRLWWSQIVQPLYEFLAEQDCDITDPEMAHALLKEKFLRVAVINKETGEELGYRTRSTTELTVEEFTQLIERASVWLCEMFGIVVLDSASY